MGASLLALAKSIYYFLSKPKVSLDLSKPSSNDHVQPMSRSEGVPNSVSPVV